MTISEMHIAILQQLQRFDAFVFDDFREPEIDLAINKQIGRFVKQRYSAYSNDKRKGFEQSMKRLMDLHTLVEKAIIKPESPTVSDQVEYALPEDFLFPVDAGVNIYITSVPVHKSPSYTLSYKGVRSAADAVGFTPANGNFVCVNETGSFTNFLGNGGAPVVVSNLTDVLLYESYWRVITGSKFNSLASSISMRLLEHEFLADLMQSPFARSSWKSPVAVLRDGSLHGYHDERFILKDLNLTYIRKPAVVDVVSNPNVDCDLPEHTHDEIVDLVTQHILEVIESSRYEKNAIETKKTE